MNPANAGPPIVANVEDNKSKTNRVGKVMRWNKRRHQRLSGWNVRGRCRSGKRAKQVNRPHTFEARNCRNGEQTSRQEHCALRSDHELLTVNRVRNHSAEKRADNYGRTTKGDLPVRVRKLISLASRRAS